MTIMSGPVESNNETSSHGLSLVSPSRALKEGTFGPLRVSDGSISISQTRHVSNKQHDNSWNECLPFPYWCITPKKTSAGDWFRCLENAKLPPHSLSFLLCHVSTSLLSVSLRQRSNEPWAPSWHDRVSDWLTSFEGLSNHEGGGGLSRQV